MRKAKFTGPEVPASEKDVAEAKRIVAQAMGKASLNRWYDMLKGPKGQNILEHALGDGIKNLLKERRDNRTWAVLRSCAPDRYRALAFTCVPDTGGIEDGKGPLRLITLDRNAMRSKPRLQLLQEFLARMGVIEEFAYFDIYEMSMCFKHWCYQNYADCDQAAAEMGLPTMEDFIGEANYSRYLEILREEGKRSKRAIQAKRESGERGYLGDESYSRYGPYERLFL